MSKKKFLQELERRLNVLNDQERQDIINEYKDIIDEKVKHGKNEKEAIEDFGSIDELVKEILQAYKINPNYNEKKNEEKLKDFTEKSDSFIKDSANKLANFTKKIVNDVSGDNSLSIEMIFEIIIKAFILLFGFLILKLPFALIREIGNEVLNVAFSPLNSILIFTWSLIVEILYFGSCILIAIIVFKKYFKNNNKNEEKPLSETKKKEKQIEPTKKEEPIKTNYNYNDSSIGRVLIIIFKIFIVFAFIIPLFFTTFGLGIALSALVYLMFKGLVLVGPTMIILGLLLIFGYLFETFYRIVMNRKIGKIYAIIIATPLIIIGGLMSIDKMSNMTLYDKLPESEYKIEQKIYYETVNDNIIISNNTNGEVIKIIDNSLNDNEIRIEANYYSEVIDINLIKNNNQIIFDYTYNDENGITINGIQLRKHIKTLIKDLKNNRIYNYNKLAEVEIIIYANENTKLYY